MKAAYGKTVRAVWAADGGQRARAPPPTRQRELREKLLEATLRRELDVVVWRLDRWGRSDHGPAGDPPGTLEHLGAGFISLNEALFRTAHRQYGLRPRTHHGPRVRSIVVAYGFGRILELSLLR